MMNRNRPAAARAGFTLTEMLVVIGIIAVLITIMVPVVSEVRKRAYVANTQAQINGLRAAIESYFGTFRAYPGPLMDDEMYRGFSGVPAANRPKNIDPLQNVTMSENLVLGLLGGLVKDQRNGALSYDFNLLGQGPKSLNLANPKNYGSFYDNWTGQITSPGAGHFTDDAGQGCKDSNVPEFIDRFPSEPLPVLYMRARVGANGPPNVRNNPNSAWMSAIGIENDPARYPQYDLRQINGYTGAKLYGKTHKLQQLGPELGAYFYSRENNSPRGRDAYILISAGVDRIYGTEDDITSFGSVNP